MYLPNKKYEVCPFKCKCLSNPNTGLKRQIWLSCVLPGNLAHIFKILRFESQIFIKHCTNYLLTQ